MLRAIFLSVYITIFIFVILFWHLIWFDSVMMMMMMNLAPPTPWKESNLKPFRAILQWNAILFGFTNPFSSKRIVVTSSWITPFTRMSHGFKTQNWPYTGRVPRTRNRLIGLSRVSKVCTVTDSADSIKICWPSNPRSLFKKKVGEMVFWGWRALIFGFWRSRHHIWRSLFIRMLVSKIYIFWGNFWDSKCIDCWD